jgi:hypothetical protein
MKGVSMIIEYTILFMFGIIILISCLSVFTSYETYFNSVSVNDQLTAIGEFVGSNVIKLAETSSGEDSSVTVKIPKRVGSEGYTIRLSAQGLNVTSEITKVSKPSTLYGLNQTFAFSGNVSSGAGSVIIYKTGNQIMIS